MKIGETSIGRATLLIVVSAISFGSISVLTVLITAAGVSLLTAMAWRYVLSTIILGAVCNPGLLRSVSPKRILALLLIGGSGQALITYVSLYALEYIPVGPLAFLFYTYPAWVALLAAVRKTEPLTPTRLLALGSALLGVSVMVGSPMAERLNPIGVVLALGSGFLYAVYLPALEQVQKGLPALLSTFLLVSGAGTSFMLLAVLTGKVGAPLRVDVWGNILILTLVSTVVAFSALIKGLAVLGPVRTSIIATIEPFFTAVLGVIVLENRFTAATLIGGVLIAGAIVMIEWSSAQLEPARQ